MKCVSSSPSAARHSRKTLTVSLAISLVTLVAAGCGGGGGTPAPTMAGNTTVMLLASSTANDQLAVFPLTLKSLTLTTAAGKSVELLASPIGDEFIHRNGTIEPLATATVPQDTYVSATAMYGDVASYPTCVGQTPGTLDINGAISGPGSDGVTVKLPAPITITGGVMGLMLNLQVSKSAPFSGICSPSLNNAVPVTPVINLTPLAIAGQPTNSGNGKAIGLRGFIAAVDTGGEGFSVNALSTTNANGFPAWQVKVTSATAFAGVANAGQLTAGMPVDMDLALQPDASLVATRVGVPDTNTSDITFLNGPVLFVSQAEPAMAFLGAQAAGKWFASGFNYYNFGAATFQVGGQYGNLANLPFTTNFGAGSMVAGQNVSLTSHIASAPSGPGYPPAATVTLMPQTVNGTVSAISAEGSFTTYTIALPDYDLFSNLAVQPGQKTVLAKPGSVVVYADSNTQKLNAAPIAAGSVLRFHGLVFNYAGTLRMDCAEISDGVAE